MNEEIKNNYCFVYVVECNDGSYYTGVSKDINKRVKDHNSGTGAKYTKWHGPVDLVYFKKYPNRSFAMKREYKIKKLTHKQKKSLVDNFLSLNISK